MKIAVHIIRIAVALLFIVSGLVKANDPQGLRYKMQEFFEVWNNSLSASTFIFKDALISFISAVEPYSLALSVLMIGLEIMAGAALLARWKKRGVLVLLLVLILFFTFLTGYAYASGKFKNCGCFGDCLPISPLTSFIKDVLLLVAILFLWWQRRYITPLAKLFQILILGFFLLLSIGLQWYVLNYLPLVDCLPYKKGASIRESMKIPANAVPDSIAIRFVYEKEGKQYEFAPEDLPADLATYKFVDRRDKLIRKGNAEPPIRGFVLSGVTNTDSAQIVLSQPTAVVFYYRFDAATVEEAIANFEQIYAAAFKKNIPVYVISLTPDLLKQHFKEASRSNVFFFKIDFTAFRTAARANPTIYVLNKGVIKGKWSGRQTGKAVAAL